MENAPENKINFVKVLTEMSSIIFAVLLALWLENWMEKQDLKDQADAALLHVTAEIEVNNKEIKDAIEANQKNINGLVLILQNDEVDKGKIRPYVSIDAGSTSNSAWESAKMSPVISIIPIEVISELTSIYDTQDYYISYVNFVFQQIADLTTNIQFDVNAKQSVTKIVMHLSIINALGSQLVESYDIFLGTEKVKSEP